MGSVAVPDVTIVPSINDDTIYWRNGAWRSRPPRIPSNQKTCGGVTREYILSLDPSRYDDEARAVLEEGFCHTFREGLANRAAASTPANETWRHASSVVGEIVNLNDRADIRYIIVEADHDANENQFDFLSFHDAKCTFGPLDDGRQLCHCCEEGWPQLRRVMRRNVAIRSQGFHPATRGSVLARSGSLQKRAADYHRGVSRCKSDRIRRLERAYQRVMDQNAITVERNSQSDKMFGPENTAAVLEMLNKKFDKGNLMEYIFCGALRNARSTPDRKGKGRDASAP